MLDVNPLSTETGPGPLISLDALKAELNELEAGGFVSIGDDELLRRLRLIHGMFRFKSPLYESGTTLLRAVRVLERPSNQARVSYPPAAKIRANGRLNRAGEAMFYGATGDAASCVLACLLECHCSPGQYFALSRWRTTSPMILSHLGYSSETFDAAKVKRDLPHWAKVPEDSERQALIRAWQARVFTRTIPEGQEHLYRLSIALRDFALLPITPHHVPNIPQFFAGILYPSIAAYFLGDNVALLPSVVDTNLKLEEVVYLQVQTIQESPMPDGGKTTGYECRVEAVAKAVLPDGQLVWSQEDTPSFIPVRRPSALP